MFLAFSPTQEDGEPARPQVDAAQIVRRARRRGSGCDRKRCRNWRGRITGPGPGWD